MAEYRRYTAEQIEQANSADLAEFVMSQGFCCERKGREIHIKGYGGLYVNPEKNAYTQFSEGKGGIGALNFAKDIMGMSFLDAMQLIVGEGAEVKQFVPRKADEAPKKPTEFEKPEKVSSYKRMYAYLINCRKLSPAIIDDFVKQGILYQGFVRRPDNKVFENAIFLHFDESGKPSGADVQGICSEARFKGIVPPTESDRGFIYHKGDPQKADTVYIFEAPIDLMSFVQLHPEIQNADFVAMGGLKPTIAEHYINSGKNVVSCVDNDEAGQKFNNRILRNKMLDSITATGDDIQSKTYPNRKPPIEYIEADVNGRHCSFFLSKTDYTDLSRTGAAINAAFLWVNKSNFTVNRECEEACVKDFNELLQYKAVLPKMEKACQDALESVKQICDALDNKEIGRER